jgi:hypothetical protein
VVNQVGVLQGVGVGEGAAAGDSFLPSFEHARSAQFPLLFVVFADLVAMPAERNRLSCVQRFVLAQAHGFLRQAGRLLLHEFEAVKFMKRGARLPEEPNRTDREHANE